MTYKKKEVKRAIEELINDMQNIVNSSHNEYQERVIQFLNRINNSEILSKLINPYFDVEIPAGYGFYNSKVGHRIEYKLPLDDDVEIGAILCFYRDNAVNPNHINNIVHWMYFGSSFDSNIAKFNAYIIVPAFEKLKRKLQYKLEDLEEIKNEDVEEKAIKIITLKNVNATNIAIGDKNIQNNIDSGIVLEDFVGISSRTAVYAESDDYLGEGLTNPTIPDKYRKISGGGILLRKHSIIGTGCTILPNVIIGEGTSVGSMSLINKSLDSWGVYIGIPCKKIKERKKDLLELEKLMLDEKNKIIKSE